MKSSLCRVAGVCLFGGALTSAGQPVDPDIESMLTSDPASGYGNFTGNGFVGTFRTAFARGFNLQVGQSAAAATRLQLDALSWGQFPTWADLKLYLYKSGGDLIAVSDDATVGTDLNGSTDARDPFLDVVVEPGGYFLLVATSDFVSDLDVIAGEKTARFFAQPGTPFPITTAQFRIDVHVDIAPTITNVTQGTTHTTLQQAIDAANDGDRIELSPGLLREDGINFRSGIDLEIVGAGQDRTFLQPLPVNADEAILEIPQGITRATRISNLTLANGFRTADIDYTGGARIFFSSPTFENVTFSGSRGGGLDGGNTHLSILGSGGTARFVNCWFVDGRDGFNQVNIGAGADADFINCLFTADPGSSAIMVNTQSDSTTRFINCTMSGPPSAITFEGSRVELINTVMTVPIQVNAPASPSSVIATNSVFPGAPAGNIDATPVFGDGFRLAPGSPGIDAGSLRLYAQAQGPLTDLDSLARVADDPSAINPAIGEPIDAGAFEYQPQAPDSLPGLPCLADQNNDGMLTGADFNAFLTNFAAGCP